jgi:hypothetical protein
MPIGVLISANGMQIVLNTYTVKSNLFPKTKNLDRFEQSERPKCIGIARQIWRFERHTDMGLSGEMIYLINLNAPKDVKETFKVQYVSKIQLHTGAQRMIQSLPSLGRWAHKAMDFVALF